MAPKAKGKAKAKAAARAMAVGPGRVRGRVLRRPGAAPVRRRPAAEEEGDRSLRSGAVMRLGEVPLEQFLPGTSLVLTKATYYGKDVQVAGSIQSVEVQPGGTYFQMKLTGTTSEDILKVATASPATAFKVHLCPRDCTGIECGDHQLHALEGRIAKEPRDEDWTKSLEAAGCLAAPVEDELALLRERARL